MLGLYAHTYRTVASMIAWQKCTTAFAVDCFCNTVGTRPGSGSSPTQSRLFCWREAITNFARKFAGNYLKYLISMDEHPHTHYALPRVPGLTRGIPSVHIGHASGLYVRAETVIKAWQRTPNCSIAPPPLRSISTSMPAISEGYGFIAPNVSCSERPVVNTSST